MNLVIIVTNHDQQDIELVVSHPILITFLTPDTMILEIKQVKDACDILTPYCMQTTPSSELEDMKKLLRESREANRSLRIKKARVNIIGKEEASEFNKLNDSIKSETHNLCVVLGPHANSSSSDTVNAKLGLETTNIGIGPTAPKNSNLPN